MSILLNPIVLGIVAAVAAIIVLTIFVKSCWKVAGTNEVLIRSGMGR